MAAGEGSAQLSIVKIVDTAPATWPVGCQGKTLKSVGGAIPWQNERMSANQFTAIIEYCKDTELYVGYIPGFSEAHSQAKNLDELHANLQEVVAMLLEDGAPRMASECVGTHKVVIA